VLGWAFFDQKNAIAVAITIPIATAFKFFVGHSKNGPLDR
jgi:hypothetical protein